MSAIHLSSDALLIPQWVEIRRQLEEMNPKTCGLTIHWSTADGQFRTVDLSEEMTVFLVQLVQQLTEARPIAVQAPETTLTTTQAAALLQMSRPHLIRLLEAGGIPHHWVGSHRRILVGDVLKYKEAKRLEAIAEMTRISQEMGLY